MTAIYLLDSGEVIFDCNSPDEPPDFIFGPDDEDFLPPMEEMEVGSYTYMCIGKQQLSQLWSGHIIYV